MSSTVIVLASNLVDGITLLKAVILESAMLAWSFGIRLHSIRLVIRPKNRRASDVEALHIRPFAFLKGIDHRCCFGCSGVCNCFGWKYFT